MSRTLVIMQENVTIAAKCYAGDNMENNLKAWREQRGLSQQQVADIFRTRYGKSTVSRQQISSWERGESSPSIENSLILAEIYKCTVHDLFELD